VIASNPHTKDPKAFFGTVESELRRLSKTSIIEDIEPEAGAFEKLRAITGLRRKS